MRYEMTFDDNPKQAEMDVLNQGIMAYAKSQRDLPPIEFFAFYIRDENNQIVGGCSGDYLYGCVYVGQLWMSQALRGQGYGTQLMASAEQYGRTKGATFAAVNTMDWEALPFYQKLGYEIELARKGFLNGSIFYFLRKDFAA